MQRLAHEVCVVICMSTVRLGATEHFCVRILE